MTIHVAPPTWPIVPPRFDLTPSISDSREYAAWCGIKQRCYNPKNKDFHYYGGRGIGMWPLWRDSFMAFLLHVGPKPAPHPTEGIYTLDRIDNDLGYVPGNVRWATMKDQLKNRRERRQ